MRKKDKVEFEKTRMLKAVRTAIRLKYALLADEEINDLLPRFAEQFDRAVAAQEPFVLDIASVFEESK